MVPILSQMNPIHTLQTSKCKVPYHIILTSTPISAHWCISFRFYINYQLFKNTGDTSQNTQCIFITKTELLLLYRDIINVYCEKHMKLIKIWCRKMQCLNVKADGTYSKHCALQGKCSQQYTYANSRAEDPPQLVPPSVIQCKLWQMV
jgi:hypothetical protein